AKKHLHAMRLTVGSGRTAAVEEVSCFLVFGLLRLHSIKRGRVVRQRQSPVIGFLRPRGPWEGQPVRARQSLFAFQRIKVVAPESAPVILKILLPRNDGQVKR